MSAEADYILDENRLRELATPIPGLCKNFLDSID